jgi:hypothetical protein
MRTLLLKDPEVVARMQTPQSPPPASHPAQGADQA